MRYCPKITVFLLSAFFAFSLNTYADSLWQDDSSSQKNSQRIQSGAGQSLYGDQRAFKEGDTVVVLIVESAQASQNASTTTEKDGSASVGIGTNQAQPFSINNGGGNFAGLAAQESSNGTGTNSRNGNLKAKVSATITKMLPNGNMEIKASRIVTINEEKESIEVTGIIRSSDVASDNTILSTSIADARISYEGKGPLGEKVKPGILTRILDWLWIF